MKIIHLPSALRGLSDKYDKVFTLYECQSTYEKLSSFHPDAYRKVEKDNLSIIESSK